MTKSLKGQPHTPYKKNGSKSNTNSKIVQTIRFSLAFFVIIFVRFQIPKYLKPDMEML